jgi:tetratricopeptide (TPR) repeat protein
MNHHENPGTARTSSDASNNPDRNFPATLCETGLEHMLAGRLLDAQRCCREALALDANDADALHLMGLLCFQAEQFDHAVEWMVRAIRQNPKPDYLSNLGTTLARQGRHEEALKTFDKAVQLEPGDDRLRVGLVWSGNPRHPNDHDRSTPLRTMARLFDVGATFVSLQKDPRPDDKAALAERPEIVDLTTDLGDLAETAALISCLDLVITVDTSVAHLAATLGRPTWLLLPYLPDWRWLLGRDDSPWYPSMRLFRQGKTRDYGEVLDRVRNELLRLI